MTPKKKNKIISRFILSAKFDGDTPNKEKQLPVIASVYKNIFNLQDRFDHYLSSIDIKIKNMDKNGRLVEIYLLISLVAAWTHWAESMVQKRYPTRMAYKLACVAKDGSEARKAFPLTQFMKRLRKEFAETSKWLPKMLQQTKFNTYGDPIY